MYSTTNRNRKRMMASDSEEEKALKMSDWVNVDFLLSDEEDWLFININREEDVEEEDDEEEIQEEEKEEDTDEPQKKARAPAASATLVSEIVRERALHLLPAKSLLHLCAVSTSWNDYITGPFFPHLHARLARSLSGVFYHLRSFSAPAYAPFAAAFHSLPDPTLRFLPEPVSVLASAHGLLCCRAHHSGRYYITNPLTADWAQLPDPCNDHGPRPELALVLCEPVAFNFSSDYFLVSAYEIADGVYGFETFSSADGRWWASAEVCFAERLVPGSGVAAGGAAHWRTTMQSVVSFVPEADSWHEISWPLEYESGHEWALTEVRRRLCCVCVKGDTATVYELGDGAAEWKKVEKVRKVTNVKGADVWPVPLRSQGANELLFLQDEKVFARDMESGSVRAVYEFVPDAGTGFVPYVSSLIPVKKW